MRIGILTFHRAYNCGAMLQAWALKTVLERMGHTVEFPACNGVGERKRWPYSWFGPFRPGLRWGVDLLRRWRYNLLSIPNEGLLISRYKKFREMYLPERAVSPEDFGEFYDLVVLGSDQIWRPGMNERDTAYFLGANFPNSLRAISYAASYGDVPLCDEDLSLVGECTRRLSATSVREQLAKQQLESLTGGDIFVAADPTLLLEAGDYDAIANGKVPSEPYLFMYTLLADPFLVNSARALARRLGVRCVIAPCYQFSRYGAYTGLEYGMSPDRLVQFSRRAKYILACSFHGTVMGVLFGKPFLSFRQQIDRYESRPAALLRQLGCEDRLVNPSVSIDDMYQRLISPIPNVGGRVMSMREASIAWLANALKG